MSKKRKTFRKSRSKRHNQNSRTSRSNSNFRPLENILLSILYSSITPVSISDFSAQVPPERYNRHAVDTTLDYLVRTALVKKSGRDRFQLHPKAPLYSGQIAQHPQGFGFVEVDSQSAPSPLVRDPFISRNHMADAVHGDRVLIRLLRVRKDNRPEAIVIKVLQRGRATLCGKISKNGRLLRVIPDDTRFPFTIEISQAPEIDFEDGDIVKVRFNRDTVARKIVKGNIIEVLGKSNSIDTQIRLVIEKFDLPHQFTDSAIEEAENCRTLIHNAESRKDLRNLDHITIDGETAKDFDDAICVLKTERGYLLYVSIADVSYFVCPGTTLDQEAYERGTSVYFPGKAIPMLPETLSNDLCSLVPNEDRFTVTALLEFDSRGNQLGSQFFRSQIRSKYRFTYTEVEHILTDKEKNEISQDYHQHLHWAEQLAIALRKKRLARGAVDFNLQEPEISVSPEGDVADIRPAKRSFAHQLIEEFMLAANESVATFLRQSGKKPLSRIHEVPDENKLLDSTAFFKTLDIHLPEYEVTPSWFASVLKSVKGSRYDYIVNNLLLRSMSQARYSIDDTGHFGLASQAYCHFTSPIRRYPDLIIHRQLIQTLLSQDDKTLKPAAPMALKESGNFLSTRERTAVDAERDIQNRLKILFMAKKIGQDFLAVISGVTEKALFIEIENLCISGAVPIELLGNDYYIFDKANFRLFGEITAKTYQIGDNIEVVLLDANLSNRKLTFAIKELR